MKTIDAENPDIRIGTLVGAGMKSAEYIRQILPHGFESFSLTFWQTTAGVDWHRLAAEVQAVLGDSGAVISSLGVFGNPLEDGEKDKETRRGFEEVIDHAHLFGCDVVAGFTGRVRGKAIHESMPKFKEVWTPLAERAKAKGVRIAFENCDMDGNWESGDWNIAHIPLAWEMMFNAVPLDNMGLEWEPCHQMCKLIDAMAQLREWAPRIFHVHGKDATVCHDLVRKNGIYGRVLADAVKPWAAKGLPFFAHHRTPGFGDSDWTAIISELRRAGYRGSIDIEGWHDPVMRDALEMTGQVAALRYLKQCRGEFIPNPVV